MKRVLTLASVLLLGACGSLGGPRELFTGSLADLSRRFAGEPPAAVPDQSAAADPCRESIAAAAHSHGAVLVEVIGSGEPEAVPEGMTETPLDMRITYERAGEVQVREARVACRRDGEGQVVALTDAAL